MQFNITIRKKVKGYQCIVSYKDGRCKHYVFVLDEESGKNAIVNIKGFEKIVIAKEVKTFDEILEELGMEENE